MLNLFFIKNQSDKFTSLDLSNFVKASNNLDSQYYVLERVKNGDSKYLLQHYFLENHPQIVSYHTSWQQHEEVHQEVPVVKKLNKKGVFGALTNKKSKGQTAQNKPILKQTEQTKIKRTQDVLYIQLQTFAEVKFPSTLPEVKQFMGLIYLLASKVYEQFKMWPKMIPVITDSKKYKFIKKGKSINRELVDLFEICRINSSPTLLQQWSLPIASKLIEKTQEQKQMILGQFLQKEMKEMISREYKIRLKQGQQYIQQTVLIASPLQIILKQLQLQVQIEQFIITYYHQDKQMRQLIMEHDIENTLTIQAHRSNLIIQYLKQFVLSN